MRLSRGKAEGESETRELCRAPNPRTRYSLSNFIGWLLAHRLLNDRYSQTLHINTHVNSYMLMPWLRLYY